MGASPMVHAASYTDDAALPALARTAISAVTQVGLMKATASGTFSPSESVSRADAVAAVAQVLAVGRASPAAPDYSDVPAALPDYGAVEAALADGWMTGWAPTSGAFRPSAPITREQFAVLVTNAMGLTQLAESLQDNVKTYGYLRDLGWAGYDLGDVNAVLAKGLMPPIGRRRFGLGAPLTRAQLAITLYRMFLRLDVPSAVTLSPADATVRVGGSEQVSLSGVDRLGRPVPAAYLGLYTAAYTLVGGGAGASVGATGAVAVNAPGAYTIDASVTGPFLTAPLTASATAYAPSPPGPAAIQASAQEVAGGIEVSWTGAVGQSSYEIEEAVNGSTTYTRTATGGSGQQYTVAGLTPGDTYTFQVAVAEAHGSASSQPTASVEFGARVVGGAVSYPVSCVSALTLAFDKPMDESTLTAADAMTVLVAAAPGTLPSVQSVTWNDSTSVTIEYAGNLGSSGNLTILPSVTDAVGNPVAPPVAYPTATLRPLVHRATLTPPRTFGWGC